MQRAEERPLRCHPLQQRQPLLALRCASCRGRPRSPSRSRTSRGRATRHWPQLKLHGIARRSSIARRRLARGRARADVELGDLADRRRAEEVVGEARRLVDQLRGTPPCSPALIAAAASRKLFGALCVGCSSVASSVAATSVSRLRRPISGCAYFERDHLALLGQADLPVHRARRLRQDRLVARAAAAPDGAAAAVEQAQRDAVLVAQLGEQRDQRDLGAVQLPVAGEAAAVLVAVAVAEHDVLLGAGALHHRRRCRAARRTRA